MSSPDQLTATAARLGQLAAVLDTQAKHITECVAAAREHWVGAAADAFARHADALDDRTARLRDQITALQDRLTAVSIC
ncbi:WXG100 family type VII secretion target [Nocardia sp. NPDC051570]|uniref:WXG100 family type VII secretion target n=1 Tax=Nocardia sp. NPDC051570 TaxID=3364324 RepID=UPI0037B738B5